MSQNDLLVNVLSLCYSSNDFSGLTFGIWNCGSFSYWLHAHFSISRQVSGKM